MDHVDHASVVTKEHNEGEYNSESYFSQKSEMLEKYI